MTTLLRDHKPGTLLQSHSGYPVQLIGPYPDDPDMIQFKILSGINAGRIQGAPGSEAAMVPITAVGLERIKPQYKDLIPPDIQVARTAEEPPAPKERKRKSRAKKKVEVEAIEAVEAVEAIEAAPAAPNPVVSSRGSKRTRKRKAASGAALTGSAPTPRKRAAKIDWLEEMDLNLKGINGTVKLGQRTLIYGPNASNKTAVLNGATLLAGGYANDVGGRDGVKLPDRLFTLAAPGAEKLEVLGRTAGGQKGFFKLTIKEDGGLKKSRRSPVSSTALLYDEIQSILRGEEAKVRSFLVRAIYPQLQVGHLVERLAADQREVQGNLLTQLAASVGATTPTALLNLDKAARRAAKDATTRGGALEALVEDHRARAAEDSVPIPAGAVATLEGELLQWRAHRDKIVGEIRTLRAALVTVAAGAEHQARGRVLNVELTQLTVELDEARRALAGADQQLAASASGVVEAGNTVHEHLKTIGAGASCLGCGVPNEPGRLAAWAQTWEPYYNRHKAATAQATQGRAAAVARVSALERRVSAIRGEVAGIERIVSRMPLTPTTSIEDYEEALEATKAGIAAREAKYTEYTTTQRTEAAVAGTADDAASRAMTEHAKATSYLQLAAEVARIRDELAREAVGGFAAKVQEWLPDDCTFGVDLDVGAVGFIRPEHVPGDSTGPGVLHTAWSGGETIRLLGALSAATIPVGCEWPILILPDRAQDPAYLRATMVALAKWPGQILATSTCRPLRGKVQGWTLVDSTTLGEESGEVDDD